MYKLKPILYLHVLVCVPAFAQTEINERVGFAYDIETSELLYTESHREVFEGDRILTDRVTYRDADDNVIAEKDVDYTASTVMPDFNLNNMVTGHKEIVSKLESEVRIVFTPDQDTRPQSELIPLPEEGIIDAGFDRFIVAHWQELIEGKQLVQKMLIPSLKKFIDFRIYQAEVDADAGRRLLKVDPNSVLIRLLADPLLLEYELDRPRLLSYKGKSNMRDDSGNNLQVRIDFPPEKFTLSRN